MRRGRGAGAGGRRDLRRVYQHRPVRDRGCCRSTCGTPRNSPSSMNSALLQRRRTPDAMPAGRHVRRRVPTHEVPSSARLAPSQSIPASGSVSVRPEPRSCNARSPTGPPSVAAWSFATCPGRQRCARASRPRRDVTYTRARERRHPHHSGRQALDRGRAPRSRRRSGRAPRASCPGSAVGPRVRVDTARRSAGSSARRPTSPTTPSTITSRDGRGGHAALDLLQRARRARGLHLRAAAARGEAHRGGAARHSASARAIASRSTCRRSAEADHPDAGDGAHRRDPLGGLRRLRREARSATASRASGSRLVFTADVTYRKGKDVRAASRSSTRRSTVGGGVGRARGRARARSVRRRRRSADATSSGTTSSRAATGSRATSHGDGGERAGLHPRDVRHDREAEARRSHARRLPGARRQHGPVVLRPEAGRRLVGDVRHRLDRRPQLHRVCAAAHRLHDGRVRGRARPPAARGQLARGGRGVRRHRHLHVADRRPDADALRRRAAAARRPLAARARGLRRRGAERAGVGLAAEPDSRRTACRSSITCGRPRRAVPVFGNPVRHRAAADQARLGGDPAARHRRGRRDARWRAVRAGREGDHGRFKPPVPRADPDALGRARALRPRLLAEDSRRLLHRRLRPRRRGRLRLVRRARRRDHQDRRPPHRHHRSRERVPASTRPWPSAASSAGPTRCGAR